MAERLISSNACWVDWILDGCDEGRLPYVLRYFENHKRRLENLLEGYFVLDKTLTLHLREQGDAHGWHLRAVLRLPTGMVVAEGRDETLMGTMDRALDTLRSDVKRHLRQNSAGLLGPPPPQQECLQPRARGEMMAVAMG